MAKQKLAAMPEARTMRAGTEAKKSGTRHAPLHRATQRMTGRGRRRRPSKARIPFQIIPYAPMIRALASPMDSGSEISPRRARSAEPTPPTRWASPQIARACIRRAWLHDRRNRIPTVKVRMTVTRSKVGASSRIDQFQAARPSPPSHEAFDCLRMHEQVAQRNREDARSTFAKTKQRCRLGSFPERSRECHADTVNALSVAKHAGIECRLMPGLR